MVLLLEHRKIVQSRRKIASMIARRTANGRNPHTPNLTQQITPPQKAIISRMNRDMEGV